ncbi:MAG: cyclic pyranopterin monophosphate synthase MoaC [Actinomycetota bacterium]
MTADHPELRARMVDVTKKDVTQRAAMAGGLVRMSEATKNLVVSRRLPKGDALEVARIAAIMGAKRTSDLIPLCHPIVIGGVDVDLAVVEDGIAITATVKTAERTGVEMEALAAVTAAALTIYDMVKSVERGVSIDEVRLLRKSGGRSGEWVRPSDA